MRGVASHPGFHTGETIEIAAPYAQARFEQGIGSTYGDYPVIVTLDMKGLRALTDYDAEMGVREAIVDIVQGNKVLTLDDLQHVCDADKETERPDSALEALFLMHPAIHDPSCALLSYLEDLGPVVVHAILSEIMRGKVRMTLLRDVTQQYRYLDPVDASRITNVSYMRPFWLYILEWDRGEREERLVNAVEGLGFAVAGPYDEPIIEGLLVYKRPYGRNARIEYHGTSYLRLLQAAPELASVLPVPPSPFGTEVPDY
jgi:hypothetical protein